MENKNTPINSLLWLLLLVFFQVPAMIQPSLQLNGTKKIKSDNDGAYFLNRLPWDVAQIIVKHACPLALRTCLLLSKKHYRVTQGVFNTSWRQNVFLPSFVRLVKKYINDQCKDLLLPFAGEYFKENNVITKKKVITLPENNQEGGTKSYSEETQSYHDSNDNDDNDGEKTKFFFDLIPSFLREEDDSNLDRSEEKSSSDISQCGTSDEPNEVDLEKIFKDMIEKYQSPLEKKIIGIEGHCPDVLDKNLFISIARKMADKGLLHLYYTVDEAVKRGYLCTITSLLFYKCLVDVYKGQNTEVKIIDLQDKDVYHYLVTGSCRYPHESKPTRFIFCSGDDPTFLRPIKASEKEFLESIKASEKDTYNTDTPFFYDFRNTLSVFDDNNDTISVIIKSNNLDFLKAFFCKFSKEQKEKITRITIQRDEEKCIFDNDLDKLLEGYPNLKELQLSNLSLTKVPNCVKELSQLRKIDLNGNSIEDISADDFPNSIKEIDLTGIDVLIPDLLKFVKDMKNKSPAVVISLGKTVMLKKKN
jgi:hypothetical protein